MAELETDEMRLQALTLLGAVVVTAPSGGTLYGIYDGQYQLGGAEPGIEGTGPQLQCRTSDVERLGLRKQDLLAIAGKADPHRLVRHEPDGTGMSILVLHKP